MSLENQVDEAVDSSQLMLMTIKVAPHAMHRYQSLSRQQMLKSRARNASCIFIKVLHHIGAQRTQPSKSMLDQSSTPSMLFGKQAEIVPAMPNSMKNTMRPMSTAFCFQLKCFPKILR